MLRIFMFLAGKGKYQSFLKVLPIIFCLSYHPSENINTLCQEILGIIPKKYQLGCLALKLFSKDPATRMNVLAQLRMVENDSIDICKVAMAKLGSKSQKK